MALNLRSDNIDLSEMQMIPEDIANATSQQLEKKAKKLATKIKQDGTELLKKVEEAVTA